MSRLPPPEDFPVLLKSAQALGTVEERLLALTRLAQFDLGYLQIIQLDNALRQTDMRAGMTDLVPVRLALLSSNTVEHLLPSIRVAGLSRHLHIQGFPGGFGQYRQELLDAESALSQFAPDTILLSLSARELIAGIPLAVTNEQAKAAIEQAITELCELWEVARTRFSATVVQQTCLDVNEPLFGAYDAMVPGSPSRLVAQANAAIVEAAAERGVLLLDLARASMQKGVDFWFDVNQWLQGKMEIAPTAGGAYGDLLARILAAQRGLSKKCLVFDLDNTLWGGEIGEDGVEGIVLGEGSALGEAYLRLQRYAKALRNRGVVLAVCSKNELTNAQAPFKEHPEMLLGLDDIAVFVANWRDKAANICAIAEALNIGLDSLVFVDDNPAERSRIRDGLPMVAVPELPRDPAEYVRCIADAGYFESTAFTEEDSERTTHYVTNAQRASLRETAQSIESFLVGLGMKLQYGRLTEMDLPRAVQLINKTNQFNTTTRRYTAEELARFRDDPAVNLLQFRLQDRFGDNGLVSLMIIRRLDDDVHTWKIENWVMSCRVFGRQLEDEVMNIAVKLAIDQDGKRLVADFLTTDKNGVIASLYERLGFECLNPHDQGVTHWVLKLADYEVRPTSIAWDDPKT